jgi:hypothetical protein
VAEVLGAALGWSSAESQRQRTAYEAYVSRTRRFATGG